MSLVCISNKSHLEEGVFLSYLSLYFKHLLYFIAPGTLESLQIFLLNGITTDNTAGISNILWGQRDGQLILIEMVDRGESFMEYVPENWVLRASCRKGREFNGRAEPTQQGGRVKGNKRKEGKKGVKNKFRMPAWLSSWAST